MDGVVSDFDQAIINVFGEAYSNKVADKFWKKTCIEAEVFRKMPPIEEGIAMAHAISARNDICFMTSTGGMPHHIDIAKQKLDWLHAHGLGGHPVAFCMNTKGKGLFASQGLHLIDDRMKVCVEWEGQGGTAHLFRKVKARDIAGSFA